jgi:hypothetical protein
VAQRFRLLRSAVPFFRSFSPWGISEEILSQLFCR